MEERMEENMEVRAESAGETADPVYPNKLLFKKAIEEMLENGEMERCANWERKHGGLGGRKRAKETRAYMDAVRQWKERGLDIAGIPVIPLLHDCPETVLKNAVLYMIEHAE